MNTSTNIQSMKNAKTDRVFNIRSLTIMAMLAGIAAVLTIYDIPLWFAPVFYQLDFSEVPVLIGAFALGPVAGIVIEAVKILLNFAFNFTDTAGIGEIANFLIGCSMVVPAAIIYKRKKNRNSAIVGMILGTLFMVLAGSLLNAYVLLPAYSYFMALPIDNLVQMGTKVNPKIDNVFSLVLYAVVPFNILKGVAVSVITMLIYKRLSWVIKHFTK